MKSKVSYVTCGLALALCSLTASVSAQTAPPLVSPPRHLPQQRSLLAKESQSEALIVEHEQPSILASLTQTVGPSALENLNPRAHASRRALTRQQIEQQQRHIDAEQRSFLTRLRGAGPGGLNLPALKASAVRNVLNATIIERATPGLFEQLKALGYKVTKSQPVSARLSQSTVHIGATNVWNQLTDTQGHPITGRGVRVGIIDTGIDYTHPDLGACSSQQVISGACAKVAGGYDWVNDDSDPMDENLHGTHVASIVAGNGTVKGVAPDATLFALRVLGADGGGRSIDVIRAIEWSTDPNGDGDLSDHLDVINLSLGAAGGDADSPDSLAADAAANAGVVVVVAAGNSGPDAGSIGSPGAARKAITVGASDRDDAIADFSSRGPVMAGAETISKPDVVAPGVGICAAKLQSSAAPTCQDSLHVALSGTSMATPHVSGLAALMKQASPSMSPAAVKSILRHTAIQLRQSDGTFVDPYAQGAGRIDAFAAVTFALSGDTPPTLEIATAGEVYLPSTPIIGTATASNFIEYRLFYRAKGSEIETQIGGSSTPVVNGQLGVLPVEELPSGQYILRLELRTNDKTIQHSASVTVRHVAILDPVAPIDASTGHRALHGARDTISIQGRANGAGFERLSLDLCWEFSDSSGCAPEAITLTSPSTTPSAGGQLGTIEISALPLMRRGLYSVTLTAYYSNRAAESVTRQFYLDPFLVRGFAPPLVCDGGVPCTDIGAQPIAADVNGDGAAEVIYTLSRQIHVVDKTGTDLPGWPQTTDQTLLTAPSLGDLDGDGDLEIVVQGYDIRSPTDVLASVYAFQSDGTHVAGWPYRFTGALSDLQRYLGDFITVADIDNDGFGEVLLSPIEVLDHTGSKLPWWPTSIPSLPISKYRMFGGFSVDDFDGDGTKEVVWTATDWGLWGVDGSEQSVLVVQNGATGGVVAQTQIPGLTPAGPVIADVDGNGTKEIITFYRSNVSGRSYIRAHSGDCSVLPGWPVSISNSILGDVAFSAFMLAADLDRDSRDEIIFHSDVDTSVVRYRNGAPTIEQPSDYRLSGFGSLIAANIDTDPLPEVLFVSRYYPQAYRLPDGGVDPRRGLVSILALNENLSLEQGFPILAPESSGYFYPLSAADIDGDSEQEILYPTLGELYAFKTGGCANHYEPWAFDRGPLTRTAKAAHPPMCHSGSRVFEQCSIHSDLDFIDDCQDLCPTTSRIFPHPVCGCALGGDDSDGDGVLTCLDQCPDSPLKSKPGTCGCLIEDQDANQNGTIDCLEELTQPNSNTPSGTLRPRKRPQLIRRRGNMVTISISAPVTSSGSLPTVRACVKPHRGKPRCKRATRGEATFSLGSGPHSLYYTWSYSASESFRSPTLRVIGYARSQGR